MNITHANDNTTILVSLDQDEKDLLDEAIETTISWNNECAEGEPDFVIPSGEQFEELRQKTIQGHCAEAKSLDGVITIQTARALLTDYSTALVSAADLLECEIGVKHSQQMLALPTDSSSRKKWIAFKALEYAFRKEAA